MARPNATAKKKDQSTAQRKRKPFQKTRDHGSDPWVLPKDCETEARTEETSPLQSGVDSAAKTNGNSKSTSAAEVALPIPINATLPCKIVAADGREAVIYTPIDGFEHLFKAGDGSKDIPCSPQAPVPGLSDIPCTSLAPAGPPARKPSAEHLSHPVGIDAGSRPVSASDASLFVAKPIAKKSRALKRSRSVAHGVSGGPTIGGPRNNEPLSDHEETAVQTHKTRTFRMGDMEGLKKFLYYRLDEFTMKPLRPIVTNWIKQLEPRRLGEYGPYHKKLPANAPSNETPPWWPQDVIYNEPAHLPKSALLSLGIDIILQHRAKDEIKRRKPWIAKLRQTAEYAIDMMPPDTFTSSEDVKFNMMMRDRARNLILPGLFDVAQSYEDYVFQHELWELKDELSFPLGRYITWQPNMRPVRKSPQRKRARKSKYKEPDVKVEPEISGDETEVDDTMEIVSSRRTGQPGSTPPQKRPATAARSEREESVMHTEGQEAMTTPMACIPSQQGFPSVTAPPTCFKYEDAMHVEARDATMTPIARTASQREFSAASMQLAQPTFLPPSSTHQVYERRASHDVYFKMREHARRAENEYEEWRKLNTAPQMKFDCSGTSSCMMTMSSIPFPPPPQSTVAFHHASPMALETFDAQPYTTPMPCTSFNGMYTMQPSDSSFESSGQMSMDSFQYDEDVKMTNASLDMSSFSTTGHPSSFDGVPYGYTFNDACQQQFNTATPSTAHG